MRSVLKKNFLYLIIILFVGFAIRYLYLANFPIILIQADTFGYYELGQKILSDKFLFWIINDERTFLYPLFLNLIVFLTGNFGIHILNMKFFEIARYIVLVQSVFGVLSLFFLFASILRMHNSQKKHENITVFAFTYTLFIAFNYIIFSWDKILLTESLGVFLLILTFFSTLKLLKKPSKISFFLLFLSLVLLFLLRPIYIALPFFIILPILYYLRTKKMVIKGIILLSVFSLIIFLQIVVNTRLRGYSGITRNSDINLLGKILQFDLPLEAGKQITYYYESALDYRKNQGDPMPYRFLEKYDFDIYKKPYMFEKLKSFNMKVITANLGSFIYKSIAQIPSALTDVSEIIKLSPPGNGFLDKFFYFLFLTYTKFQYLLFLIFPFYPYSLYKFLRHPSYKNTILAILGTVSSYQILFSVFLSYGEFGRLISIVQPLAYLYIFASLSSVIRKVINSSSKA